MASQVFGQSACYEWLSYLLDITNTKAFGPQL